MVIELPTADSVEPVSRRLNRGDSRSGVRSISSRLFLANADSFPACNATQNRIGGNASAGGGQRCGELRMVGCPCRLRHSLPEGFPVESCCDSGNKVAQRKWQFRIEL